MVRCPPLRGTHRTDDEPRVGAADDALDLPPGIGTAYRAVRPLVVFERLRVEDVVAGEVGQHHHARIVGNREVRQDA